MFVWFASCVLFALQTRACFLLQVKMISKMTLKTIENDGFDLNFLHELAWNFLLFLNFVRVCLFCRQFCK